MDVEERLEEERRLMKGTERKKEGVGVRLWLKCRIFSKELVFVFSEYVSIKRYEIFKSDRINVSKVLINKLHRAFGLLALMSSTMGQHSVSLLQRM